MHRLHQVELCIGACVADRSYADHVRVLIGMMAFAGYVAPDVAEQQPETADAASEL